MPPEQTGSQPEPRPSSTATHQSSLSRWLSWPSQAGSASNTTTSAFPAPGASAGHNNTPPANTAPGRIQPPAPASRGPQPPALPFPQSTFPPRNTAMTNTGFLRPQPPQPQSRPGVGTTPIYPPLIPARGPATTNNTGVPLRQSVAPGSSAMMEQDELANTDEDDDPVPLVLSDLAPRRGGVAGAGTGTTSAGSNAHKASPKTALKSQQALSLSLRSPFAPTPRKTAASTSSTTTSTKAIAEKNGAAKATSASSQLASPFQSRAIQQPIVSIPLARPPPASSSLSSSSMHLHPLHSSSQPQLLANPIKAQTAALPFSISIPLPAPSGGSTSQPRLSDTGPNSHLPTLRPPMAQAKLPEASASNASASTAQAKSQPIVQIKGGRPKGWKPGMSYREVALRNMGVDTSDPTLPPEFLLPQRNRRNDGSGKRPPGRPRVHGSGSGSTANTGGANGGTRKAVGRPRLHKTAKERAMFAKRVGRPPLVSLEEMQRNIFHESTAQFVPFLCEWAGCRAELQNLATLRRHIDYVHGRGCKASKRASASASGPPTCLWRKCATRTPPVQFAREGDGDEGGGTGPKKMTFMEHMEYYHLEPLSWHQGDGFANTSYIGPPPPPLSIALAEKVTKLSKEPPVKAEEERNDAQCLKCATTATPDMAIHVPAEYLPGYLLEGGRQVTPLLRDPALEMSSAFWSADEWERRNKEAYRQHNRRPERGWTG